MFWGCFHGNTKGPGLFWEKDWGTIKEESYRAKILPIINGWIQIKRDEGEHLIFIQDSAPAYAAKGTIRDLKERGIIYINWPSYSPDLNLIKAV